MNNVVTQALSCLWSSFTRIFIVVVVDVVVISCSFPYTYNGGLYYSCIEITGVFVCINVNATPAVCNAPGMV